MIKQISISIQLWHCVQTTPVVAASWKVQHQYCKKKQKCQL